MRSPRIPPKSQCSRRRLPHCPGACAPFRSWEMLPGVRPCGLSLRALTHGKAHQTHDCKVRILVSNSRETLFFVDLLWMELWTTAAAYLALRSYWLWSEKLVYPPRKSLRVLLERSEFLTHVVGSDRLPKISKGGGWDIASIWR